MKIFLRPTRQSSLHHGHLRIICQTDARGAGRNAPRPLAFLHARLKSEIRVKPGLTRFLPAILSGEYEEPQVELVPWQGSGDIAAQARSNCYIVIPPDREQIPAGDWVAIMRR